MQSKIYQPMTILKHDYVLITLTIFSYYELLF